MRHRRRLGLALAAGLATTALAGPAALAAPAIGTSSAVRGDVFVTTSGARRAAAVRDAIRLQDQVLTKDDSALQILLLDRTTFTVGQNANLTITRFIYDPANDTGRVAAKVTKGAFRFMSGNIGKANPTNASVATPSATIGIRGTFFEGVVGADAIALAGLAGIDTGGASPTGASLVVLRGPGRRRNTLDRTGAIDVTSGGTTRTIAQAGYAIFVPAEGARPSRPFAMSEAMEDYLDFFLRSKPSGPSVGPRDETGSDLAGQSDIESPTDTGQDRVDDVADRISEENLPIQVEPDDDDDEPPSPCQATAAVEC